MPIRMPTYTELSQEQLVILEDAALDRNLLVTGPPGTGKTHTIANIICHYLATGRSVLVVSKGEPALEVLRSQIPDDVRDLTISLLTSERQGLKQLEAAVTFMANHVLNKDMRRLELLWVEKEKEIVVLRQEIEHLDADRFSGEPWLGDRESIRTRCRDRYANHYLIASKG